MIDSSYLETVRNDILSRVNGGSILLNNSISIPVIVAEITSHPVAGISNAIALSVQAPHVTSVPIITNAKLRTFDGKIVSEKNMNITTNGAQFFSFTFVIEVKGG